MKEVITILEGLIVDASYVRQAYPTMREEARKLAELLYYEIRNLMLLEISMEATSAAITMNTNQLREKGII